MSDVRPSKEIVVVVEENDGACNGNNPENSDGEEEQEEEEQAAETDVPWFGLMQRHLLTIDQMFSARPETLCHPPASKTTSWTV
jgi:hypothetical protein